MLFIDFYKFCTLWKLQYDFHSPIPPFVLNLLPIQIPIIAYYMFHTFSEDLFAPTSMMEPMVVAFVEFESYYIE